jgi:hypothetical protein
MVRSKGGQVIIGTQYITQDKKDKQLIDSSRYALMVFRIADADTIKHLGEMFGKMEYKETLRSTNINPGASRGGSGSYGVTPPTSGRSYTRSEQVRERQFLDPEKLQAMPAYHHITIIPSEGLAYLGYTKLAEVEKQNANFEEIDMLDLMKHLRSQRKNKKTLSSTSPEETESGPAPEDLSEEDMFIHYFSIKFAGSEEEAAEYIEKNKLQKAYRAIMDRMEERPERVMELLQEYDEEERWNMMREFFSLPDRRAQYQWARSRGLIGALLGIFVFSKKFLENHLEGGK